MMIEKCEDLSIKEQSDVLGFAESSYHYQPKMKSTKNLEIMRLLDEIYLDYPYYGSRKMRAVLK